MNKPPLPEGFSWLEEFPSPDEVCRLLVIPFDDGVCVAGRKGEDLFFPEWRIGDEGEAYFEGAYLAPLREVGFRYQQLHPFAVKFESEGLFLVAWEHGELLEMDLKTRIPFSSETIQLIDRQRAVESPSAMAARLRGLGKDDYALLCEAAFHSYSNQTEETYFADNKAVLERAYLKASTPQGGSGSSSDDAGWRLARRLHVEAIRGDGTYLDTGCANGLLMESMVEWAEEEGYKLEPYGVDISEKLVEVARGRSPQWSDHIYVGNAMYWEPPIRFDYVTTRLEYVPEDIRADLVRRLLDDVVASGGRLIVTSYGCSSSPELTNLSVAEHLTRLGFKVAGEATAPRQHIAWIDKA